MTTYHYLLDANSRSILVTGDKTSREGRRGDRRGPQHQGLHLGQLNDDAVVLRHQGLRQTTPEASSCRESARPSPRSEKGLAQFCSKSDALAPQEGVLRRRHNRQPHEGLAVRPRLRALDERGRRMVLRAPPTGTSLPQSSSSGSFLSALLSSLDSDEIALVKSESALFLTDTAPRRGS